jgi:RHS repeat-associated protein
MEGTFNLNSSSTDTTSPIIQKTLPSGYRPVTGYTGHINEDKTGLIYMRGRYYSPAWHRFINSDQGVDPNSLNQYAYVGGSPFMATDPSGMQWWCNVLTEIKGYRDANGILHITSYVVTVLDCWDDGGGGDDVEPETEKEPDPLCKELEARGITQAQFERMKSDMNKQLYNDVFALGTMDDPHHEFGHDYSIFYDENGGGISTLYTQGSHINSSGSTPMWTGTSGAIVYPQLYFNNAPSNSLGGYTFHTHSYLPGFTFIDPKNGVLTGLDTFNSSGIDRNTAGKYQLMHHFLGTPAGLNFYNSTNTTNLSEQSGNDWWNIDCPNLP